MDGSSARAALGLSPDASVHDVKRAFRALAKQTHPDTGGDRTHFEYVAEAYDVASRSEPHRCMSPRSHPFLVAATLNEPPVAPLRHYRPRRHRPSRTFADELAHAMSR